MKTDSGRHTSAGEAPSERIGMVVVAATLLAWLSPIGVGGRMPVGGDVTRFRSA